MIDLRLTYYNAYGGGGGVTTVHLDKFFPCGAGRLRELLRIVRSSGNPQGAMRELTAYLERRLPQQQAAAAAATVFYYAKRQQESDVNRRLESGKYENGVMIPKGEIKLLRSVIRGIRSERKRALSDAKTAAKGVKQLEKCLALLREER